MSLERVVNGIDRAGAGDQTGIQQRQRIAQETLGAHGHSVGDGIDVVTTLETEDYATVSQG